MSENIILIVIGAGLATYFTRFPLMVLSGNKHLPEWLRKYMNYIAPAVLTALIAPSIFYRQGKLDLSLNNDYLIAAVITGLAAYFTKNMLAAVVTGLCAVGVLTYLI